MLFVCTLSTRLWSQDDWDLKDGTDVWVTGKIVKQMKKSYVTHMIDCQVSRRPPPGLTGTEEPRSS